MRWHTPTWANHSRFDSFWHEHLSVGSRKVLYILGLGFDPRMNSAAMRIFPLLDAKARDCLLLSIEVDEVIHDDTLARLTKENLEALKAICGQGNIQALREPMFGEDGKASGPRKISKKITNDMIRGYTDVILDIGTLPRMAFITLISYLIDMIDKDEGLSQINLHVVVTDNAEIDQSITGTGTDMIAQAVVPFSTDFVAEQIAKIPRIWVPILSKDQVDYLKSIKEIVRPSEVCPLLPFPARNPRRADDIILTNPGLFEMLKIEPGNLLYADESNPFDVYTQLIQLSLGYGEALAELGGANMVFSPLSNKIQTVGATLAAYELQRMGKRVSIVQMLPTSYVYTQNPTVTQPPPSRFHSLWLTGTEVVV